MLIYDSHCHLAALTHNQLAFRVAVPAIIPSDMPKLVAYRAQNHLAKIGCGLHPWYLASVPPTWLNLNQLRQLVNQYRPDFIGETGLDKFKPGFDLQLYSLRLHLHLAQELDMPIVIHCVRAYSELLQLLSEFPNIKGIVHAFNGNRELAKQLLRKNMFLGVGSIILNPNSQLHKSIAGISGAQLLLESDAPFMPALNKITSTSDDCWLYAQRLAQLSTKKIFDIADEVNYNWLKLFN